MHIPAGSTLVPKKTHCSSMRKNGSAARSSKNKARFRALSSAPRLSASVRESSSAPPVRPSQAARAAPRASNVRMAGCKTHHACCNVSVSGGMGLPRRAAAAELDPRPPLAAAADITETGVAPDGGSRSEPCRVALPSQSTGAFAAAAACSSMRRSVDANSRSTARTAAASACVGEGEGGEARARRDTSGRGRGKETAFKQAPHTCATRPLPSRPSSSTAQRHSRARAMSGQRRSVRATRDRSRAAPGAPRAVSGGTDARTATVTPSWSRDPAMGPPRASLALPPSPPCTATLRVVADTLKRSQGKPCRPSSADCTRRASCAGAGSWAIARTVAGAVPPAPCAAKRRVRSNAAA